MSELREEEVYGVLGEDGFARLVRAFYSKVPDDDILGPMYPPEDLDGAEQRLRDYLVGRFGGPPRYVMERGHPRLRARHMPFRIDVDARNRWMQNMEAAFVEAETPPEVVAVLRPFFAHLATFMINS